MSLAVSFFLLVFLLVFLWTVVRWFAGIGGGAPFVPVPRAWLEEAFTACPVSAEDVVVDLGSGSGTILNAAAGRGARVTGYEFHPILALSTRWRLRRFGDRARIIRGDLFTADLSDATIVTVFGLASMREKLLALFASRLATGVKIVVFLAPELPYPLVYEGKCVRVYRFVKREHLLV